MAKKKARRARNERTSKKVASIAGGLLRKKKTPKKVKSVAASVLTQAPNKPKRRKRKK